MLTITALFHDAALLPLAFGSVLLRMGQVIDAMALYDGRLVRSKWRLAGNSDDDARRYPAFDSGLPATAALAVLKEKFRKSPEQTYVGIWDGGADSSSGVSMACQIGPEGLPGSFTIRIVERPLLEQAGSLSQIVSCVAREFSPACIEAAPLRYAKTRVFRDKPGVGWMLYLPAVLSARQVPEAGALIPVPEKGRKQTGTIIVSVTDAVFSVDNPAHIEIANRIEIRLVDQDLLPRYLDI